MRKYIIKRLFLAVIIFFFVMLIIYTLMRCLPSSYIENVARSKAQQPGSKSYEEWMEQLTAMYKACLDIVVDWAVETPTYQRQNAVLFSTERINMETMTPDITTFYGWASEIENIELN